MKAKSENCPFFVKNTWILLYCFVSAWIPSPKSGPGLEYLMPSNWPRISFARVTRWPTVYIEKLHGYKVETDQGPCNVPNLHYMSATLNRYAATNCIYSLFYEHLGYFHTWIFLRRGHSVHAPNPHSVCWARLVTNLAVLNWNFGHA